MFQRLQPHLDPAARQYWKAHPNWIKSGVIHSGKFEKYFALFRNWLLPLVHSRKTVCRLLEPKSAGEQAAFFKTKWNNLRWRLLMAIFFSRTVMGRRGRDPRFLRYVDVNVPQYIRRRADAALMDDELHRNYFLHYIFTGHYGSRLPVYLREENYEIIRSQLQKVRLRKCSADDALREEVFTACCLSNIFEYYAPDDFDATARSWAQTLKPATRLLFWNLMAPRSFAEVQPGAFENVSVRLPPDNGFFYAAFLAEQKK